MELLREDALIAAFATVAISMPVGLATENVVVERLLATVTLAAWSVVAYSVIRIALQNGRIWRGIHRVDEPMMFWGGIAAFLLIWLGFMGAFCLWGVAAWLKHV